MNTSTFSTPDYLKANIKGYTPYFHFLYYERIYIKGF